MVLPEFFGVDAIFSGEDGGALYLRLELRHDQHPMAGGKEVEAYDGKSFKKKSSADALAV